MRLTAQQLSNLSWQARGRRKYGNIPEQADGHLFDSRLEARRYQELKLLWIAGQIHDLEHHQKFELAVNGTRIGYYEADFTYQEDGKLVVEDCKGIGTPLYRWKKSHLKAQYGIEIREIRSAKRAVTRPPTPL